MCRAAFALTLERRAEPDPGPPAIAWSDARHSRTPQSVDLLLEREPSELYA